MTMNTKLRNKLQNKLHNKPAPACWRWLLWLHFALGLAACWLAGMPPAWAAPPPPVAPPPVSLVDQANEDWSRTFARPVAFGAHETLFFERDGYIPLIWRLNWNTGMATATIPAGLVLSEKARFSAVHSSAGLWLIGPGIYLQTTDGRTISMAFDGDEPTAVALADGSVLLLGHSRHHHTEQLRRLVLRGNSIVLENLGLLPHAKSGVADARAARYGVAALALKEGKVFAAGGGSDHDVQRAALIDPATGQVQPLPDMPHKRTHAAVLALPDGRILVAGGVHLRCQDHDVNTVDLYDPRHNAWHSLPDLPFPLCAEAYYAEGPSAALLADGTIVLGGHLERHVLALRPAPNGAQGYAAYWEVAGPLPRQRIGGTLQAMAGNQVALAGGLFVDDGCCRGTPGANVVKLPLQPGWQSDFQSFGLPLVGAGVAQRGNRVIIGGGSASSNISTWRVRISRLTELLDLQSGKVQQLPPMPIAAAMAQALWLDDDRILFKGLGRYGSRVFERDVGYPEESSSAFTIFSLASQRWSTPVDLPELSDALVLEAHGDFATPMSLSHVFYRLQLSTAKLTRLPLQADLASGATARQLPDGRVVLAGGMMRRLRISLLDEACEDASEQPEKDCPEQWGSWGPLFAANRYQWVGASGPWQWSQPSTAWQAWQDVADSTSLALPATDAKGAQQEPGEVLQTVIDAQGRVLRLIRPPRKAGGNVPAQTSASWVLERSNAAASRWQALPWPPVTESAAPASTSASVSASCQAGCKLLLAADPRHPGQEMLFLRDGVLEGDYAYNAVEPLLGTAMASGASAARLRVWWFDEAAQRWHAVLQADKVALRQRPLPLKLPLSHEGATLMSLGWHLPQPILWLAPK